LQAQDAIESGVDSDSGHGDGFAMKLSEYFSSIEDLKSENKDLRKQLERTSRKLTESQARTKELFDALRVVVNKDHPALRRKK
jgi:flagellar biosynthesis chaperone FliJ